LRPNGKYNLKNGFRLYLFRTRSYILGSGRGLPLGPRFKKLLVVLLILLLTLSAVVSILLSFA